MSKFMDDGGYGGDTRAQRTRNANSEDRHYLTLKELAGDSSLAALLAQYVAPDALSEDGKLVECLPMREARHRFSVREALAGARIFSATRGQNANVPVVMISLEKLADLVREAGLEVGGSPDSLVSALAASEDLPPASRIPRARSGRFTSKQRFLAPRRILAR